MNRPSTLRRRSASRAFTLIEVLLVIVIIGMLATVLIVTVGGTQDKARIDTTKLNIDKIARKLDQYNLDIGRYPNESDGGLEALMKEPADEELKEKWAGPYVRSAELKDAWGNDLNYEALEAGASLSDGTKFKLWSNGPDGQSNTKDDVRSWEEEGA